MIHSLETTHYWHTQIDQRGPQATGLHCTIEWNAKL